MSYVYQKYPRVKYHATREPVTVANEAEERKLGKGWEDTPAAFPFYNRKPTDPIPNVLDDVNAEREHWYRALYKEQVGTTARENTLTRIRQLEEKKHELEALSRTTETRESWVDSRIRWIKNHKLTGGLVLIAIIIIFLNGVVSALQSLLKVLLDWF